MKALGILGKTPGKWIWIIKKSVSLYHFVPNPSPLHRLTSCEWISWTPHMSEKKGTITAPCMGEIGNNGATSMRENVMWSCEVLDDGLFHFWVPPASILRFLSGALNKWRAPVVLKKNNSGWSGSSLQSSMGPHVWPAQDNLGHFGCCLHCFLQGGVLVWVPPSETQVLPAGLPFSP